MIVVMTYLWTVKLKYISPSVSITQRPQYRYNKSVVVAINIISPYLIDWVVQFWWLGLEDMNFSPHLLFPQHNLWNTKLVRSANTAAWTGLEQGALFAEALVTERNGENIRNELCLLRCELSKHISKNSHHKEKSHLWRQSGITRSFTPLSSTFLNLCGSCFSDQLLPEHSRTIHTPQATIGFKPWDKFLMQILLT